MEENEVIAAMVSSLHSHQSNHQSNRYHYQWLLPKILMKILRQNKTRKFNNNYETENNELNLPGSISLMKTIFEHKDIFVRNNFNLVMTT